MDLVETVTIQGHAAGADRHRPGDDIMTSVKCKYAKDNFDNQENQKVSGLKF